MSTTETPSQPIAATRQEQGAPESAEAIANRILGTTSSIEMTPMVINPQDAASAGTPGALPTVVSPSANLPITGPSVTSVEAGTAAAPIADPPQISEALHGDIGAAPVSPSDIQSRALHITIIIPSTDSRHRYVLDDNYLARRSVSPPEGIITNITVYTLKELIWRDWRPEWEPRPTNPSSVRLIHMGRMLEDNTYLRDNRFQVGDTPHVVHMNVRPEVHEEDDGGKIGKTNTSRRSADGEERTPGCRCILM